MPFRSSDVWRSSALLVMTPLSTIATTRSTTTRVFLACPALVSVRTASAIAHEIVFIRRLHRRRSDG